VGGLKILCKDKKKSDNSSLLTIPFSIFLLTEPEKEELLGEKLIEKEKGPALMQNLLSITVVGLERFKYALQHHRTADFTIGSLGDDE